MRDVFGCPIVCLTDLQILTWVAARFWREFESERTEFGTFSLEDRITDFKTWLVSKRGKKTKSLPVEAQKFMELMEQQSQAPRDVPLYKKFSSNTTLR